MSDHVQKKSAQESRASMAATGPEIASPKRIMPDARPEAIAQRKLQSGLQQSAQVQQAAQLQSAINQSQKVQKTSQLQAQTKPLAQQGDNKSGLPGSLRAGLEQLSGIDMSDVQVHYNSAKPTQVQAHAYAQGNEIFLGPGQEHLLPHEAYHIVQQKQGRVKATEQIAGMAVNTDASLEKEADTMGEKAVQLGAAQGQAIEQKPLREVSSKSNVLQRMKESNSTVSIDEGLSKVKENQIPLEDKKALEKLPEIQEILEPQIMQELPKPTKTAFKGPFDPIDKNNNHTDNQPTGKAMKAAREYIDQLPMKDLKKLRGEDVTKTALNPKVIELLCKSIKIYDETKSNLTKSNLEMRIDYDPITLGILGGCHQITPIFGYLLNVIHQDAVTEHNHKHFHSLLETTAGPKEEHKYIDASWRQDFPEHPEENKFHTVEDAKQKQDHANKVCEESILRFSKDDIGKEITEKDCENAVLPIKKFCESFLKQLEDIDPKGFVDSYQISFKQSKKAIEKRILEIQNMYKVGEELTKEKHTEIVKKIKNIHNMTEQLMGMELKLKSALAKENYKNQYGEEQKKKLPPVRISDDFPELEEEHQRRIEYGIDEVKSKEINELEKKSPNKKGCEIM